MAINFPINDQAEFDAAIKERLNREAKKYEGFEDFKDKASKYDELISKNYEGQLEQARKSLKEKNDELNKINSEWQAKFNDAEAKAKEQAESSAKALSDVQSKLSESELVNLRVQTALEAGLPYTMASRLVGTTAEELKKDAETLVPMMKGPNNPFETSDPGKKAVPVGPFASKIHNEAEKYAAYAQFSEDLQNK